MIVDLHLTAAVCPLSEGPSVVKEAEFGAVASYGAERRNI